MEMPITPWKRDAISSTVSTINDVKSVPNTFSSFQNCMAKNYCKYLFIFGCVAAGITLICLIACIACCCCGVKNCCCPGSRKTKYRDSYRPAPAPNHGGGAPPPPGAYHPPAYGGAGGTQFATFDVSKPHNDALPAMPSWETASTRKVEVEEDVELGTLDPPGTAKTNNSQQPMLNGAAGFGHAVSPTESHRGPHAGGYMDPHSPYGNHHDHHDSYGADHNSGYGHNGAYHPGNENSGWSSPHPNNNQNANRPYSPYGPPSAGTDHGNGPGPGAFNFSRGPGAYSSVHNNGGGDRYSPQDTARPPFERTYTPQTVPYPDDRSHTPMIAPSPRHGNLGSNFYENRNDYGHGGAR